MSYTDVETAAIVAASPLTFEGAEKLALELGKTQRSIIAKAKSLGVDYIPKAKPTKRAPGLRKADLIAQISEKTGEDFEGLSGATMQSLQKLVTLL
jgi:hypothetical protein